MGSYLSVSKITHRKFVDPSQSNLKNQRTHIKIPTAHLLHLFCPTREVKLNETQKVKFASVPIRMITLKIHNQ